MKFIYVKSLVVCILIITGVVLTNLQFDNYQKQLVYNNKENVRKIIEDTISQKESQIKRAATSLDVFDSNRESVKSQTFDNFSKVILEQVPQIKNIAITNNGKIIESYPYKDFENLNLRSVFPSYPCELDGVKVLNAQFPTLSKNNTIVISVPYDFFVNPIILSNSFKIILSNPEKPDQKLYELSVMNSQIETGNVVFSDKEQQDLLIIEKQTKLFVPILKHNFILKYQIWDESFQPQVSLLQHIFPVFGIAFSVIVSLLLARHQRLSFIIKKQSEVLKQANEQLLKTAKTKDEFVAMLAHELRTPLVPISGYVDILLGDHFGKLNENQKQRLNIIKNSTNSLLKLVSDILDVHKLELGQLKIVKQENNIKSTVEKSVEIMKILCSQKSIDLINHISKDHFAKYDDERIRQVITNLIRNGINSCTTQTGTVEIFAEESSDDITISVKDNGKGIPQDAKDNIFRKFYQVDASSTRETGGSGLGLAISKGIVETHGGKMWFESEEGEGSTFLFSIPKNNDNESSNN